MKRLLAVVVALAVAVPVLADVPPPRGFKRVDLEYKVTTEKEYPDYLFFVISGGDKATALKLGPKTPATVTAGGGRYRLATLVAIPRDAAKKYDSEKAFLAAVATGKVAGMLKARTGFFAFTEVKDTDDRKVIVIERKIESLDPKAGIVFAVEKKGPGAPPPPKGKGQAPESEEPTESVTLYTPKGGVWVAGLAATMAFVFVGLWFFGRSRRG